MYFLPHTMDNAMRGAMTCGRLMSVMTGAFAILATLVAAIGAVLRNAKQRFPNLRIAYLARRIYAGYPVTPLNPEPYVGDSGFGTRCDVVRESD